MMGKASKGGFPLICNYRHGGFRFGVWVVKLNSAVVTTSRQKLAIMRPTYSFHCVLVRFKLPYLLPCSKVPDFHNTVTTSARKPREGLRILAHLVDTIDMTFPQLTDKRSSKHPIHFGRIQSSSIFSRPFEGMNSWVEVSRLSCDI